VRSRDHRGTRSPCLDRNNQLRLRRAEQLSHRTLLPCGHRLACLTADHCLAKANTGTVPAGGDSPPAGCVAAR
jgi:hypothetical protein